MKYEYKISDNWFKDRLDSLEPYTTKQEKAILLLDDDKPLSDMLSIISDIKPLNDYDTIALLFKYREISVSDIIEATQECPFCKFNNPVQIEIKEFFNFEKLYDAPVGLFATIDDVINSNIADEIILKEYDQINENILEQTKHTFKPVVERTCIKCKKTFDVGVNPKQIMSKSNPSAIFKEYLDLSYFTANSVLDIDTMFPYEREIYLNILKDRLKEDPKIPK